MSFGLYEEIANRSPELGFPVCGAVDLEVSADVYAEHFLRFERWLAAGRHGEMGYLDRGKDRRKDPRIVYPEVKSIVCVLRPYCRQPVGELDRDVGVRYARYLKGGDYHSSMTSDLNKLLQDVRAIPGNEGLKWKVCVDTSAVLERSWAALCGLGWIGKNTLLIHPKLGSYTFIGVAFLNQVVGRAPRFQPNLCGHCTKCVTSCPTGAFSEPGELDARRCISYLTLEKKNDFTAEESQRVSSSSFVAGCDICQEVCPFNLKPSREEEVADSSLVGATDVADWTRLLDEVPDSYRLRVKESSLGRVKAPQFRRNLEVLHSAKRKP